MKYLCPMCGRETEVAASSAFNCPRCGNLLQLVPYGRATLLDPVGFSSEAENDAFTLVQKATHETDPRKKRALLAQAIDRCPDSLAVNEVLLHFGQLGSTAEPDVRQIPCYLLSVFDTPDEFSFSARENMLCELTDGARLNACLALAPDADAFLAKYCGRLCGDYLRVFVKGSSIRSVRFFGIPVGRQEKTLSAPVARMLRRMERASLPAPFDTLLPAALRTAWQTEIGDIQYLDLALENT